MDLLIKNHADVNYQSSSGKTALMVGCYAGSEVCDDSFEYDAHLKCKYIEM